MATTAGKEWTVITCGIMAVSRMQAVHAWGSRRWKEDAMNICSEVNVGKINFVKMGGGGTT